MERRLGRGLGSLLSDRETSVREPSAASSEVDVAMVRPNPHQPRRHFDPEGIDELAASLKAHGVLQPIVVRRVGSAFELIAGERRLRAAQRLGFERIPAVVRQDVTDDQMLELALVENVQRRDLNPIERALGYRSLLDRLGLTQDEAARRVGLNRATIANHLRLLELPAPVQEAVSRGQLSMGHARALLGLPSQQERLDLANKVVGEGLSVRQVERAVREALDRQAEAAGAVTHDREGAASGDETDSNAGATAIAPWVATIQDRLQEALGTKVEVRTRPGYTGQIVIHYFDREDLDRLLEQLAPQPSV